MYCAKRIKVSFQVYVRKIKLVSQFYSTISGTLWTSSELQYRIYVRNNHSISTQRLE